MAERNDGIRPLNQPRPVPVDATEGGRPLAVHYRGRMQAVVDIRDTWRIDDEWWRTEPISRRYFEVTLDNGHVLTLYVDLVQGSWFLQPYSAPRRT